MGPILGKAQDDRECDRNCLAPEGWDGQKRDLWSAEQHENEKPCEIDSVTRLPSFERFVFVMSILERYFELGLLSATGMQWEHGDASAGEGAVQPSKPRCAYRARRRIAIASC